MFPYWGRGQKGKECDNNTCCGFKLHLNLSDKTIYVVHCRFLESNDFNCNWVQKRCSKLYIITKNMRTTPTDTPDTLGVGMTHQGTGLVLRNPSPVEFLKVKEIHMCCRSSQQVLVSWFTGRFMTQALFKRSSGTSFRALSRFENND